MITLQGPPVEEVEGIGALTIGGFLADVARHHADNEALVFDDPLTGGATVRWTYADLLDQARKVAGACVTAGVAKGDRVAILMGNRPEAVASLFGAAMAGAVVVPLSTFSTTPELDDLLRRSDPNLVLTQTELLGRDLMAEISTRAQVVAVGRDWDRFLASGEGRPQLPAIEPTDLGLIIFSSGTTSAPKGVVHNHRAPTLQFWIQSHIFGRHERTRMWTALPMFWTAGLNTAMGATLAAGGCWVMQETFEPGAALKLMAREEVTEPYTLPHQTQALAEHPDWLTTDLSSLRCVFGKSAFARHPSVTGDTGWNMPVAYGLSETCALFVSHYSNTPRQLLKESIGRLMPGNQLRVVDPDTGAVLDVGEVGELAIKGPTLMEHYLGKRPEECFDADGFFHTGDTGSFDADGYVQFLGRRTEMIKTGGANVSPAELEVALRACEPVKLARIVGIPDDRLGERVVLCAVLKDGAEASGDDIVGFLRERVASYKVPKNVLFFADGEIPMTSDIKVRDTQRIALVEARLAKDATLSATNGAA